MKDVWLIHVEQGYKALFCPGSGPPVSKHSLSSLESNLFYASLALDYVPFTESLWISKGSFPSHLAPGNPDSQQENTQLRKSVKSSKTSVSVYIHWAETSQGPKVKGIIFYNIVENIFWAFDLWILDLVLFL